MIIMVVIFVSTIVALIKLPSRAPVIFGAAMLATFILNLVDEQEILQSATNVGLLSLVLLLLASVAVEKTSLIRWLSAKIDSQHFSIAWLKLYFFTAFSSAFLNNTAIVSTLISPIRNNKNLSSSKLLIVLSYAAILGGTLTLVGTSTNLLVNSMLLETGHQGLGFFELTKIGLLATLVCAVVIYFVSSHIPEFETSDESVDDYLLNAKVTNQSNLIGKSVKDANLRHLDSLFLVEIIRDNKAIRPVTPDHIIKNGDRLVFSGDVKQVAQLNQFSGLQIATDAHLFDSQQMTEVVVKQNSILVNKTLKTANFRSKFNAAVIAIKRDGQMLGGKLGQVRLQAGDFLVLATGNDFKKRENIKKNFIFLSGVEPNHKLTGYKQAIPVIGFLAVIASAALGILSLFKGLIVLLAINLLTKTLQLQDIRQRFPFEIWLIISSALVLAHGIENTGLVNYLVTTADFTLSVENSFLFMVCLFITSLILTELVTNNAAAALAFPFAYGLPSLFGLDPMPFVLAVIFGANASFISPFSYQTNLMVFNAGQYRFSQFVKAGLPVSMTYSVVVLTSLNWVYF